MLAANDWCKPEERKKIPSFVCRYEGLFDTSSEGLLHLVSTKNLSKKTTSLTEKRFRNLVADWRNERRSVSSTSHITSCNSYQRIIGMGLMQPDEIVPLILHELEERPDFWFSALREITKDEPIIPPEDKGDVPRMARLWLDWGKNWLSHGSSATQLLVEESPDSWHTNAHYALDELRTYPKTADKWAPQPPTDKAFSTANTIIDSIDIKEDIPVPRLWPTPEGGVRFGWRTRHREVDIEVLADGSIEFLQLEEGRKTIGDSIDLNDQKAKVNELLHWLLR